ncbi:MAG: hypothetical protein KDC38_21295, partial [Planctomycetes bacterium]|nr:hypothetical protein [Planctomycetota bacterium]
MSSQGGTGVLVPGLGNISRVEFEKHIRFYRSGGPDDEGIRVSGAWTARFRQGRLWGWDLGLKIDNQSDQHLEIDWDRTAFVGPDRKSLRVIPGDTRVILSNVSVPPAIVPPGSRGEWELFRVDTLDVKRHTPTTPLLLEWPENEVRIDIDCKIGGSPRRLTTEWGFQCDVEEVLERREEKEQQRRRFNRRLAVAGGLFAGLPVAFLVAFFVLVASTSLSASGRRSSASLA